MADPVKDPEQVLTGGGGVGKVIASSSPKQLRHICMALSWDCKDRGINTLSQASRWHYHGLQPNICSYTIIAERC